MASGSYNGIGVKVPDLLLYGALAVGAYFIYKTVVKPTSEVTEAVGTIADETGESYKSVSDLFQAGVHKVEEIVTGENKGKIETSPKKENPLIKVSNKNHITSISPSGSAYGVPLVTVKTNTGQSATIGAKENTYYPNLGIGFNSKGQGYSSLTAL